ncbi:MAG: hypothetical protein HRT80_14445 [Henriciella sp.]|nr:hypothetical protein [Henriciella sp.]
MSESSLPPSSGDEAPIDAEFEPAIRSDSKETTLKSGPGWFAFGLLGLVSGGALLLAAASAGYVPGFKPGAGTVQQLENKLAGLESIDDAQAGTNAATTSEIDTLKSRADSLQADRTRTVTDIRTLKRDIETLQADISTLQRARIASLADERDSETDLETPPSAVPADLSALQTRVASLEDALVSQLGAYDATLETQRTRVAELETQAQTETLTAADSSNARTEAALALSAIEAAARRGRPFLSAHQRLSAAMPNNQAVGRLSSIASEATPTIADLRAAFPALRAKALDQDAQNQGGASGWMRGLFGDGIQVRHSGEVTTGDQLDAATAALQAGDLGNTIQSVRALDANLQPVFTDWLDNADNRLLLEETLEALRLTMIAEERP